MARGIPNAAGGLLSYCTRHRTVANLLFLVMIVAGLAAIPNMRTQFFPDVVVQRVTVTTVWQDVGAENMDRAIVQLIEPALQVLDGVESTQSSSSEGRSVVTANFEPSWDMTRAAADVRSAIDDLTGLPDAAEEPEINSSGWGERVTDVVISGPIEHQQLVQIADEFVVTLFEAGVTKAGVQGVLAPETLVTVPSLKLIEHGITMAEIAEAIAAEADTDPAGNVSSANARIRTGTERRAPDQIAAIVLRRTENGGQLSIGDIATVERLSSDRGQSVFVGDNPAVVVDVDRSLEGDAVGIQRTVEKAADALRATLPEGVEVALMRTRAEAISQRLNMLINNGLMGLALVVGLLFLFLNARTAIWVAAGIPAAMMASIAIMYLGGLTLNMISLFGLIITLGIVVDDAIVVGEHADYRSRHFGEAPVVAAENAARRMALPVFAATLTTVIAFFGLVVIGGRFGSLIRDIPLTVIAVLVASLVECFLILPNHMAHALAAKSKERWYDWPSRQVNRGFNVVRDRCFRPLMAGVIAGRYVVLAGVVLILASQIALFIRGDVQWRFFNAPERSTIYGNFAMVDGATRAQSMEMMRELQRATETVAAEYEAEYGQNPIKYATAIVGGNAGRGLAGVSGKDRDLLGGVSVELIDADLRPYTSFALLGDIQSAIVNHPLAEVVSFRGGRSGPGGDALSVEFYGAEAETLKLASLALQRALQRYPEVSALEDTLAYDQEEVILDLTAKGQAMGFTIDALGRSLQNRLSGIEAASFPEGRRSATIRVELPQDELTADFLERTQMRTPAGGYVPLADIVSVQSRNGFGTVRRVNGQRVISVTGDISEDNPERAGEIQKALSDEILPQIASEHQVGWVLSGLAEQESDFLSQAMTGLILCLTGIYLVLAWVFSSWTRPAVVMAIIPFGLVGTIYGHASWDIPMSMFTVVGLLGMTGIIINDSIVLITTIDDYAEDRGLFPSIIDGAADRLRPVMLTTLTTVLGLVPLLFFEQSLQAEFLKPTIVTLVYGLGFGMVLVLLIVPALMAAQHDIARQVKSVRRAMAVPVRSLQKGIVATALIVMVWGGATIGFVLVQGTLPSPLQAVFPNLAATAPLTAAYMLFVGGTAVACLVTYAIASVTLRRSQKAQV